MSYDAAARHKETEARVIRKRLGGTRKNTRDSASTGGAAE